MTHDVRAIDMTLIDGQQFHCIDTNCLPFSTMMVSDIFNCQVNCLAKFQCTAARFHRLTFKCDLFGTLWDFNGTMVSEINVVTLVNSVGTRTPPESEGNWVINGDGETGPCQTNDGITPPTGWDFSGPITQVKYDNSAGNQLLTDPGPDDRGRCHFYGHISAITTMWQMTNLTISIDPRLIDNQTISFNFSAWIGGYFDQDDHAQISLTFFDQTNQNMSNSTILGPVLAEDRDNSTSLLFRQTNGRVPIGARAFQVQVTLIRTNGASNDGDVDNILLRFYQ